jgi:hypothetical protein
MAPEAPLLHLSHTCIKDKEGSMRYATSRCPDGRPVRGPRHLLLATLIASIGLLGCPKLVTPPGGAVTVVPLDELPQEARFTPVGDIGRAFRLEAGGPAEARFPVQPDAAASLLPATVRLFRFDDAGEDWVEIADSRFDQSSRTLVGSNLEPGLYTAFGWSANPAANALQRLIFDAANGFGPPQGAPPSLDRIRELAEASDVGALAPVLAIGDWLRYTYSRKTWCKIVSGRDCLAMSCGPPRIVESCPTECTAPCCTCDTIFIPTQPRSPFPAPQAPMPCQSLGSPILCPVCPLGLSCPSGPFVDLEAIRPTLPVLDREIFRTAGFGEIVDDEVLRVVLDRLVEQTVGQEYPVPPPYD